MRSSHNRLLRRLQTSADRHQFLAKVFMVAIASHPLAVKLVTMALSADSDCCFAKAVIHQNALIQPEENAVIEC
jgi:hypothetical protein